MDYNSYGGGQSYTTTYGATGDANNGGGFVGGEPTSSQAQGRGYGQETIRPVTVAQILSASQPHPDADFKIDGEPISHLTFVGQVRSMQPQATNITYKVEDGTGIVEVKQWINSDAGDFDDDDSIAGGMDIDGGDVKRDQGQDEAGRTKAGRKKKEIKEDDYVRVWGKLKDFNGRRHIGSHIIRPISDYNEINYHLLEATSVHLKVYQSLREANNNEGLNVHVIASNSGMNISDVYRGVDELVQEGVIFTTLDDETYAILDA
ncbi:hypothetical protein DV737_g2136, partial [Chaetothyriales sp. CBS 132003]